MHQLCCWPVLTHHWRLVIGHLPGLSDVLRLAGSERGLHRLRLQRRGNRRQPAPTEVRARRVPRASTKLPLGLPRAATVEQGLTRERRQQPAQTAEPTVAFSAHLVYRGRQRGLSVPPGGFARVAPKTNNGAEPNLAGTALPDGCRPQGYHARRGIFAPVEQALR